MEISVMINDDGTVEIVEDMPTENLSTKREFKGKSSTTISNNFTIIDIETTGYDVNFDEIIELSAIKVRNKEIQNTFQSLVQPEIEIDEFITDLTGITNDMLKSAPILNEVLPLFLDFIGDDIIVGHNVNFDINFIYDHSLQITGKPLSNNFIDTLRLTRKLFPDAPNHKLITLAKHFKLNKLPAHRAMADCEATLELYDLITNNVEESGINLPELFKKTRYKRICPQVTTTKTTFDTEHLLYEKYCVFTGTLEKIQRKNAMQLVVDLGGYCTNTVTKKTNYLVLGNLEYCKTIKDGQSSKLKKAQSLILSGYDLEIISENVFFSLINPD
ncbi:DNA polymerase III PolC-type [Sporomusa ovata DSM 2662]|uniref:DNA polymerase III alpha subunit n=1 Tax=Sporomusa ovata TaxID=2378 RepID=A0A0U1L0Z8_9FIRM|nr:exonuclease domain-containing protein [Sporomusa ovata]EQB27500.1 DNA polymerase III PolC-type [Sporomusa ovata DSM 2662]CQR73346.1 DNA polymerase III alpha subunit [Sporomusa ovata]